MVVGMEGRYDTSLSRDEYVGVDFSREENEKFKIPVNFLAYTTAMREPAYQI